MPKRNESIRTRLLEFLGTPGYQPLKDHDLANVLHLKGGERPALRALLRELEDEGRVTLLRTNRWALSRPSTGRTPAILRGTLRVSPRGHGFVAIIKDGTSTDYFLERDAIGNALDGDTVEIEPVIRRDPRERNRRTAAAIPAGDVKPGARIIRVVERRRRQLVGLLMQQSHYWYVVPDNPRLQQNVEIERFDDAIRSPRPYRKVVVRLEPSDHLFSPLRGVVAEDLGAPDAPGVDMQCILKDKEIAQEFSEQVLKAAKARSPLLDEADRAGRRDLRTLVTATIDPVDAKDFDDAVSLERLPGGGWRLYVHIADVAHFVKPGSTVDREALHRGNSVYMVDRHIPMLPAHLTGDVCSLRPHSDRLAHTVVTELDAAGRVTHVETFRSVIHSSARLNYEEVQKVISGEGDAHIPVAVRPAVHDMIQLSGILRRRRLHNGALDLSAPEVKVELDKDGHPLSIRRRGSSEAYHVIEEFMLVANVAVAEKLAAAGWPTMYRIHEPPSEEQWARMGIDLGSLGIADPPQDQSEINEICRSVAGTPREYAINLAILKNLKRAMYSAEREVHFGLAFKAYVHFTSPIRRYADLVIHRQLCHLETSGRPLYDSDDIAKMAEQCSITERTAAEAEQESLEVKRIEYYGNELAAGRVGPHHAIVVGFVGRGLLVEIVETLQRGLLPFAAMTEDFYEFDAARGYAQGQRTQKRWLLGQELDVLVARIDTGRRMVDFAPVRADTDGRRQTGRGPKGRRQEGRKAQESRPAAPVRPGSDAKPSGGRAGNRSGRGGRRHRMR